MIYEVDMDFSFQPVFRLLGFDEKVSDRYLDDLGYLSIIFCNECITNIHVKHFLFAELKFSFQHFELCVKANIFRNTFYKHLKHFS